MIPTKGKGVVQTRFAISLPLGVYVGINPNSELAMKKFIDMGTGGIASNYRVEIGVILFNHSVEYFQLQVSDKIGQFLLEKIENLAIQKLIVVSATNRSSGGFGS